jgi:hypothetical protein
MIGTQNIDNAILSSDAARFRAKTFSGSRSAQRQRTTQRISACNPLPEVGRTRYYFTINLPRCFCACDLGISAGFFAVVRKALAAPHGRGILENFTVQAAGVAQSAEHRFCKPRVESSSLSASSVIRQPARSPVDWSWSERESVRQTKGNHGNLAPSGWIPKRPKGPDCKSGGTAFAGSNPAPPMLLPIGMEADRQKIGL